MFFVTVPRIACRAVDKAKCAGHNNYSAISNDNCMGNNDQCVLHSKKTRIIKSNIYAKL